MGENRQPNGMIPNSFQTPNLLVDRLMPLLDGKELRIVIWAYRHILGWVNTIVEREATLSLSAFEKGHRGQPGCGLGRPAIVAALKSVAQYGVLRKVGEPDPDGQRWGVPESEDEIDWDGLERRRDEKARKNRKRTRKATAVRQTNSDSGSSDEPAASTSDEPAGSTSDEPSAIYIRNETQLETQSLKPIFETHPPDPPADDPDESPPADAADEGGGGDPEKSIPENESFEEMLARHRAEGGSEYLFDPAVYVAKVVETFFKKHEPKSAKLKRLTTLPHDEQLARIMAAQQGTSPPGLLTHRMDQPVGEDDLRDARAKLSAAQDAYEIYAHTMGNDMAWHAILNEVARHA